MTKSDALIGQELGRILIQQPLGHGGMARVYKGFDQNLRRPVAIKVIAESLRQSASYAQRFERESQAVANLKHPNIVTVFQFGSHDALYYLVMEYIDGVDLDVLLRSYEDSGELMPHADVLRILQEIAGALDYAHAQGVIHRDVKPSNIMLERGGRPVLTDFGLALRISEGTMGDTFGSPHYIAPEQARSSSNAVPQSDVYALGVIAYEMLTGVVPFDDPSPAALAVQHITNDVPSPRLLNRSLPEAVEPILLKVLAKEPKDRYRTCKAFVGALRKALKTEAPVRPKAPDLPPLPAGVELPPPRRLSVHTAQDKLDLALASVPAEAQMPPSAARRGSGRPMWRTCALQVVIIVVLTALVIFLAADMLNDTPVEGGLTPVVTDPNGQLLTLFWDHQAFYGANHSQDDILMGSLSFEKLRSDGSRGERFEGRRWSAYYPRIQVSKCVVLKVTSDPVTHPGCASGINAMVTALDSETFWLPAPNATEFWVLWKGQEIARCPIAQNRCEVRLPLQ